MLVHFFYPVCTVYIVYTVYTVLHCLHCLYWSIDQHFNSKSNLGKQKRNFTNGNNQSVPVFPPKMDVTSPKRGRDQHKITCCRIKSRTRWDTIDKRVRLVLIDLYGNKSVQFGHKVKNDSWNSPPCLPYRGGCCADLFNIYQVEIFGESCASFLPIIPHILLGIWQSWAKWMGRYVACKKYKK